MNQHRSRWGGSICATSFRPAVCYLFSIWPSLKRTFFFNFANIIYVVYFFGLKGIKLIHVCLSKLIYDGLRKFPFRWQICKGQWNCPESKVDGSIPEIRKVVDVSQLYRICLQYFAWDISTIHQVNSSQSKKNIFAHLLDISKVITKTVLTPVQHHIKTNCQMCSLVETW